MKKLKIIAITQARSGSTRLPGKVHLKIGEETLLQMHLRRIGKSKHISKLIVATTIQPEDDVIESTATNMNIESHRGSVNDVLDRFYRSVLGQAPDYIVRLTSDCPLIDPALIDKIIMHAIANNLDYCSNTLVPSYPDGQDVEVVKYTALVKAWNEATLVSDREHVTPFIWRNSTFKGGTLFQSANFQENFSYGHQRMTVDEQRDFQVIEMLVQKIGGAETWLAYAKCLEANQNIAMINGSIERNEGYTKSLNQDTQ